MQRFTERKRGRPSISKPKDCPEFFQVYLPEHNSQKLLIPPAFMKNFEGEVPEKVILKTPLGKTWEVKLEQEKNKVHMTTGWESYVKNMSLDLGEFLIFQYDGDHEFTVKVFNISGCEKGETNPIVEVEPEEKLQSSSKLRFSNVDDGKIRYEIRIPAVIIQENNIRCPKRKFHQKITLRNQSGLSHSAVVTHRRDGRIVLQSGWKEFYEQNHIGAGDEYELEILLDQDRRIKEVVMVRISRKTQKPISRVDFF